MVRVGGQHGDAAFAQCGQLFSERQEFAGEGEDRARVEFLALDAELSVVDESALIAALEDGRIGFAALDVFEVEPLPAGSPLWTMPNVLISPHTAALAVDEEAAVVELFADNATRLLDGHPLVNVVDTVEFY
ncbi:NAD(P)-dependent oxidoreductase [Nonomuraea sp. NPDC050680]|uniref:NAD(P)-dependent oxidoreductase n=1 Tax=Nonomuraea sp. NPDC050680 TaxID=3154630 RepID=UPI0033CB2F69